MASAPRPQQGGQVLSQRLRRYMEVAVTNVINSTLNDNGEKSEISAEFVSRLPRSVYPEMAKHPILSGEITASKVTQNACCAAGVFVWSLHWNIGDASFFQQLAKFYMSNCRNLFPDMFPAGSEVAIVGALQSTYDELTNWPEMIKHALILEPDEDPLPTAIIIDAAVTHAISSSCPIRGLSSQEHCQKMTETFMTPLAVLLGRTHNSEILLRYLNVVKYMDVSIISRPQNQTMISGLVNQLQRIAIRNIDRFEVAKKSVDVIGYLARSTSPIPLDSLEFLQIYMSSAVIRTRDLDDDMFLEVRAAIVERAMGLAAAFTQTIPFPDEMMFYEVICVVATDSTANPSKWSELSHKYAIQALYFHYCWSRTRGWVTGVKHFLLNIVLNFMRARRHSLSVSMTVINFGLETITFGDQTANPTFSKAFFEEIANFFTRCIFNENNNALQMIRENFQYLTLAYLQVAVMGLVGPQNSAVLYRNLDQMSDDMVMELGNMHTLFWQTPRFSSRLCATMMHGLRHIYVDLFRSTDGKDPEFSNGVTFLEGIAAKICTWLVFPITANRHQYKIKSTVLSDEIAFMIKSCQEVPEVMGTFCQVLSPFVAKLLKLQKTRLVKLTMKCFPGMSLPGVRTLILNLRLTNVNVANLSS